MSESYLSQIYYDTKSRGSYGGTTALWNVVKSDCNPRKLKYNDIKRWLKEQDTYNLHKPYTDKFKRETIIVKMDEQWDADLMVLDKLSRYNKGYKYLALFILIFKICMNLKRKTPQEMVEAMNKVFDKGRTPETIGTDQGKEYMGKVVQEFLKEKKITHIIAYSAYHANYAERAIRTLKGD